MKNKIAFFGASVTQQSNGYSDHFRGLNPSFEVSSFGHGSMHLNDAGVCYIDSVLEYEPEYCFIDWFSTGYIEYNKHKFDEIKSYIDTILYKFLSNDIKLIFLTFPDVSMNSFTNEPVNKKEIYKKINDYIVTIGIPTIDISESFDDLNIILRDGIHTTPYGSEQYGKLISEEFNKNIHNKIEIPETYPPKNKYCEINTLDLNATISKKIVFDGESEIIGISQTIGPYSGLLRVNGDVINNWDRWCYYERPMVNLKFTVNGNSELEILEDDFDRSVCEHNCNWGVKKLLKIKTIYYSNNN